MKRDKRCKDCIFFNEHGFRDMGFSSDICEYISYYCPLTYRDLIDKDIDFSFVCPYYIGLVDIFKNFNKIKDIIDDK